jgi:HD-like signal output (HDOD) protein
MSALESFFVSVKLPAMSETAHALIKTLENEDASATEVAGIIAKDPSLSAKLLRLANCAQFGLPRGVGSVDDAITMVGMSKVRTLSLGACLNESFPVVPGLDRTEFWQTCMACAGYAQWLARHLNMDSQQAWLTGMMLRLGELLIGQAEPVALAEIEKSPHLPGGRWERESRLLGFTEGQITAELARRWKFPADMVTALEDSSDPLADQHFSRLAAVLHLAELLAETPHAGPEALDSLPQDVVSALMLDMPYLHARFPAADSFVSFSVQ